MEKITLDKQDMMNICTGAGFFASGGGGSVQQGYNIINKIWELPDKKPVVLCSPHTVPDDAWLASVAMIGAPDALGKTSNWCKNAAVNSLSLLEKKLEKNIDYLLAVETGSLNIVVPMIVAAIRGLPYVDCTGTSRSVPKIQNTTYAEGGVNPSPAAFANDDTKGVTQYMVAEGVVQIDDLARNIIENEHFNQMAGFANFMMTGEKMKETGSLGCVTMAKELGEALGKAGENPFEVIHNYLQKENRSSYLLGKGVIQKMEAIHAGGFDSINISIETTDDLITVIALNENLLAWSKRKSSPIAMAPDLISYVDKNGKPLSNADIKVGDEIFLIVAQATKQMRVSKIIDSFLTELKAMGYYGPYVRVEEIHEGE